MHGRWILVALLLSLIVIGGGVLVAYVFIRPMWSMMSTPTRLSFDSDGWRSADSNRFSDNTRLRMVDGLLASRRLIGSDRATLEALLGPPDVEPYLLVEQPRHAGAHIYRLGPDHLNLDSMWLVVTWDESGRVAQALVVSD